VEPSDPLTYAAVGFTLAAVATLAALLPAWRASRLDPVLVLSRE
jgi:ABC-type lipoprotein release transport system permease subunit